MKKLNISIILFLSLVVSFFVFGGQFYNVIGAQEQDCFSPDTPLSLTASSLIQGEGAYTLENLRIQVSSTTSFTASDRIESQLHTEGVEVTDEGLKPLSDSFVIYVSGSPSCQYHIRTIAVDSTGTTVFEGEPVYMNLMIEEVSDETVTVNVLGIPDETEVKTIAVTVGGQNLVSFKYRINSGTWIEGNEPGTLDITFNYGLNSLEVVGVGTEGESDVWSKTFEVKIPADGVAYPVYLGGYGYEVILNYYYWLAISHYKKSLEYREAGNEEEAFEAERLAYAYYDWAEKVEDRISRTFDYDLPTTDEVITVTIGGRSFRYTEPYFYDLLEILEQLITTYLQAGYTAQYKGKINDAIRYFDIVILLDPYNEMALKELEQMLGTYTPSYMDIFTEEVDPRFIYD